MILLAGCSPVTTIIAEAAPVWNLIVVNIIFIFGIKMFDNTLKKIIYNVMFHYFIETLEMSKIFAK